MKSPDSLSIASLLVMAALSGCSGSEAPRLAAAPAAAPPDRALDGPQLLGAPYQVGAVTYTPDDPASYDEVGYAGVYGVDRAGQATANGEPFKPAAITAAHKTLPLPSYVEVTALETGRTILVRVNDRGPFANDRLIDLSEGAARQLGLAGSGAAGVRVRRTSPIEQERALLRAGQAAAVRIDTPEMLLRVLRDKLAKLPAPASGALAVGRVRAPDPKPAKPPVARTPVAAEPAAPAAPGGRFVIEQGGRSAPARPAAGSPVAAAGSYGVQVAAFASRARAEALAARIGARVIASSDRRLYRVRFGPYPSADAARAGVASARRFGYPGTVTRE